MTSSRTVRAISGIVLAGGLLLGTTPAAVADQVRNDQWPLEAFGAEEIWKVSTGKGVTVAVIDDGVYAKHRDLKKNVIEGKDFIDNDSATNPEGNHGTGMASIIAAHGHGSGGSQGVKGLAPDAKILAIRDMGLQGKGVSESIRYAVDEGADIINMSIGGTPNPHDAAAIKYALDKDVLLVSASGNTAEGPGGDNYPARYPGVLGVGGIKSDGELWESSNFGPHVLLTAPAKSIVTAGGKDDLAEYGRGSGTSNSASYVSATAALIKSKFPDLTPGQIVNRMVKTAGLPDSAKDLSLPDQKYGHGYIQPLAALTKDIPAGPKMGPLKSPELPGSKSPSPPAATAGSAGNADSDASASSSSDSSNGLLIGGAVATFVVALIGAAVFLVRRQKRRTTPPPPPGYGAGVQGAGLPHQPGDYPMGPPPSQGPPRQ